MTGLLALFFLLAQAPTVHACCLGGTGVPTPLYSSTSCRACPNGWFDKRRDFDNVPNYHNVRLYICPMAYAGFQLYSPGRSSCNSGWYPTCYQCPSGYIARAGTSAFDCINCPSGIASNGQCVTCTAGQYSSSGCQDCPAGQYNGAFTGQTSCTTCVAGKYCSGTGETANNNDCSAGTYGSSGGQTSSSCSGSCPLGQYCPAGSTGGTNCPASYMAAAESGLSSVAQCVDCAPGYTCTAGRGPVGSAAPPAQCGSSGSTMYYCQEGSEVTTRQTPLAGYYASNPAETGTQTFTTQTACEAGWYCPGNGQRTQCPAGRYGSSTGGPWTTAQCEGGCAAGFNCPIGSLNKFQEACAPNPTSNGARTYYCPAGQGRQSINTVTEYTTPETAQTGFRTGKAACLDAEFCSNGNRQRRISWGGDWTSCAPSSGGAATFSFAEGNDANGDGVVGDFTTETITATTPVAGNVVFSITGGSSVCKTSWTNAPGGYTGQFEISGATTLQLKNGIELNFEDCPPPDGYSVQVKATKGSYSETCNVFIKVGDVNEKPLIPLGQSFTIPENSEPTETCGGGPVTATDSEVDNGIQAITWTIFGGCTNLVGDDLGSQCPFVIGVCDGQLRVTTSQYLGAGALNFESTVWPTVYTLTITANDDGPGDGQFDRKAVTLTITDVNEKPSIKGTSEGGTAFDVSEHASDGFTIGTIEASDVDTTGGHDAQLTFTHHNSGNVPFAVSTTGTVTVDLSDVSTTGGINFEAPKKVHDLIVSVADSGWGSNPPIPLSTASVIIAVTVADMNDNPTIDTSWIDPSTSKLYDLNAATVLVFPEDCVGTQASAAGSSLSSCKKQLKQTDPDDVNADDGVPLHQKYKSDSAGWTLVTDCSNQFELSTTGLLTVKSPIDYEAAVAAGNDPYCTVAVKVTDQSGASDTMTIAVKIADVNEAPLAVNIVPKDANVACWTYEDAPANTIACDLKSTDPDFRASPAAQTHAYSITGGTGSALYAVYNNPATVALSGSTSTTAGTATGASISLVGNLNFESQQSYTLNFKVKDTGFQQPFGLETTNVFTILVKDVNEAPSFTNLATSRSVAGKFFTKV